MESKAEEYANLSALMIMFDCEYDHLGIMPSKSRPANRDIKHLDPELQPKKSHFPSVIATFESGSQGEKLYTRNSDKDFLHEIGPGTVYDKANLSIWNTLKEGPLFSFWKNSIKEAKVNKFYWTKTDNDGFYNIEDEDGNFLYPVLLQRELYSVLKINEETDIIDKEERYCHSLGFTGFDFTLARVKAQKRMENRLSVDETGASNASIPSERNDRVIAMRLDSWPCDIKDDLVKRSVDFSKLTGLPLFLVPKSHPRSKHPKVEWRLSFSMVEKEIMLNFPQFWRKAYLLIKDMCRKIHDREFRFASHKKYFEPPLKSYYIKTVLMWVYEEQPDADQTNMLGLLRVILQRLLIAFEEMSLPNYFIPSQNIMLGDKITIDGEKIDTVKKMLRDLLHQDNLNTKLYFTFTDSVTLLAHDESRNKITKIANVCLMLLAEEYNACLASFCNLMSLMFHDVNKPRDGYFCHTFVKRYENLRKALYRLANTFGLSERKVTNEFSNIHRSCDSYLKGFIISQNLPAAYRLKGGSRTSYYFLDCHFKEIISGVNQTDEISLQKLEEDDITKWFDHIVSVIKNGVEDNRIPLNEYCDKKTMHVFKCTECLVPCFSSYKETLTNPVKMFEKFYAAHKQQLRALADEEIKKEEKERRKRLENEERVRRYKEETEKEEQRRREGKKSREEVPEETDEQKEEVQQKKEKGELKKKRELIKQPTPRRSERIRARTSKPYGRQ